MKNRNSVLLHTVVASAIALAYPMSSAHADEVKDLTSPDVSELILSVRNVNEVNPLYRLLSGGDYAGTRAGVDVNIVRRSEDGTWVSLHGTDLGLHNQEMNASYEAQGKFKVEANYNEIAKYAPYTLNTKVAGVGTDQLKLNTDWRSSAGLGPQSNLRLERTGSGLNASVFLSNTLKFNFALKSEKKAGAIMSSSYGSTWNGANSATPTKNYGAMYFAPQPENYQHNQFDFSFDYFSRSLQLNAGYYLSNFSNAATALNITPGNNALPTLPCAAATCITAISAGPSAIPWISLPPDNSAQQWYLSGGYSFSEATRLNFKVARERATQNDAFIPAYGVITPLSGKPISPTYVSMNPPGVPYAQGITNTSLGGLVDTTTYFASLTSRLTKDLDMLASWRYENREDKTPQRDYLDPQASAEYPDGASNDLISRKISHGKAELSYRLPAGYRLVGGVDVNQKKTPDTMRTEVTDKTIRGEISKTLDESLNGRVSVAHSNRTGGEWELLDPTSFPTATNVAAPLQFADRKRDKVSVMIDWAPLDPLSLQMFYEHVKDVYPFTPVDGNARMGMTDGQGELFGLDASWKFSDSWKVNGYYSLNQNKTHQNELYTPRVLPQTCQLTPATVANTCVPWQADLDLRGDVFGLGLQGRIAKWDVGAQVLHSKDRTRYNITFDPSYPSAATSSVPAGAGVLPDTVYSVDRLKLSGSYAYSKAVRMRLDYLWDVRKMDDYTWTHWMFTDGTRVNVSPSQTTRIIGFAMIYSF